MALLAQPRHVEGDAVQKASAALPLKRKASAGSSVTASTSTPKSSGSTPKSGAHPATVLVASASSSAGANKSKRKPWKQAKQTET